MFDKEAAAFGLRQWSSNDDEGSSGKETAQSTGTGGYGEGAGFVNEWLMLFSDAFSGLLLAQMLKFPRPLSLFGLAQLATDIDYFHNVIHATGIKPHPLFGHVKNILLWRLEHPKEAEKLLKGISQGKSCALVYCVEFAPLLTPILFLDCVLRLFRQICDSSEGLTEVVRVATGNIGGRVYLSH